MLSAWAYNFKYYCSHLFHLYSWATLSRDVIAPWSRSFNFGFAWVHLLQNVSDHWLEVWQGTALALCQQWRPQSRAWDSETGLGARSLEAVGPALHPLACTSPAQPRPAHPSSPQPPPPCGLPAPSPAALFWLQLLGVYVCVCCPPQPYPLFPVHLSLFPSLIFSHSLIFSFMICPLTVCLTHSLFFHLLCLSSFPPLPDTGVVIVPSNYWVGMCCIVYSQSYSYWTLLKHHLLSALEW